MKKLTTMLILLVTAAVISTGAGKLAYGEARMTAPEFEIGASDVAVLSDVENEAAESASEDEADEDEPFTTDYGLTVTGDTLGTDFTYDSSVRVLTIISDTSVIISGTTPAPPNEKNGLEDKIVVRRRQILPSGML